MISKPYIIGISGESGVGKSTLAEIISLFFGEHNTAIISTDDLHKWERHNPVWSSITHLNPNANNLELGDFHLQDLVIGKPIYRSVYNHKTGWFNPPKKIEPQSFIIIEGLHAFYTDISQSLIDLKIFVDADRNLITHWKLLRDTEERGYKYNDVLEIIKKRSLDNGHLRDKQIGLADAVVKIDTISAIHNLGNKHETVEIAVTVEKKKDTEVPKGLLEFIENYLSDFSDFTKIAETIGQSVEICQNGGGNISVKSDDFMIIKASGYDIKDISCLRGYSVIMPAEKHDILNSQNDSELNGILKKVHVRHKTPSMEVGVHLLLRKYVIHTHAIYPTLLLCLENSKEIISALYSDLDYEYVDYATPGHDLFVAFKGLPSKPVYFLENHGIVISSDNLKEAVDLLNHIHAIAKEYICGVGGFEEFDISFADKNTPALYPFPDAVIFYNNPAKRETTAAHNYINSVGWQMGNVRHLTDDQVRALLSLESEKHRQSI
jgi:uridine kinase/ribulose-5-phosphate 4-epimerase/fuculose-1-phosphate aldolase